ncbi:MAG: winged helix-turn-helix domain-containing protein [Xanthobacteraceae bacterium]
MRPAPKFDTLMPVTEAPESEERDLPSFAGNLLSGWDAGHTKPSSRTGDTLTPREREVLAMISQGFSNTDQPLFKESNHADVATSEISFGPFRLLPAQLLLLEGDKPVPLGSRALHILMVLLDRPGELVTKQELMARVWPNLFVEPATLTVHISALRRAPRDGRDGNRFIINIRGRGYCFVTPTR